MTEATPYDWSQPDSIELYARRWIRIPGTNLEVHAHGKHPHKGGSGKRFLFHREAGKKWDLESLQGTAYIRETEH